MFQNQLSLIDNNRNIDELHQRLDYQIIQTISFHNQYETAQFQALFQQISSQQQIKTIIKRLDKNIQNYWQAISATQSIERTLYKWKKLQSQKIFSRPYLQLGVCYQTLGLDDKAIEYYQKCLQIFNNNDMGYYLKGKNLLKRKMVEQGIVQLKIGYEINRQNKYILQTLGDYYQTKQNWSVAVKYYKLILQIGRNEVIEAKIQCIQQGERLKKKEIQSKALQPVVEKKKSVSKQVPIKKEQIKNPNEDKDIVNDNKIKQIKKPEVRQLDKPKEQLISKSSLKLEKQQSEPKQLKKKPSKYAQIQNKIQFQTLHNRIKEDPSKGQNYWAMIQFCKNNDCEEKSLQFLEQLIQNGKRQYPQTIRICKQLQQMYYLYEQKTAFNLFPSLEKNNKYNVFVFLYHAYLSILMDDRQQALKAIDAAKITIFVDEELQGHPLRYLLQNYLLLFSKLIGQQNLDLPSLEEYFKSMLILFQKCFNKQHIVSQPIVKQQIFLKNLIVQCCNQKIQAILFLYNQITSLKSLTDILLKEQVIFIVTTSQQLQKKIKTCLNIVVYPSSLKQLQKQIDNCKKSYQIYVSKTKEQGISSEQIMRNCVRMKQWNGRIKYTTQLSYSQIWMNFVEKSI